MTIGIFDSGMGGLTVMRALKARLPQESFLYLGSSYRLRLVANQEEPLLLKDGTFCLSRQVVEAGGKAAAGKAFRNFYAEKGLPSKPLDRSPPQPATEITSLDQTMGIDTESGDGVNLPSGVSEDQGQDQSEQDSDNANGRDRGGFFDWLFGRDQQRRQQQQQQDQQRQQQLQQEREQQQQQAPAVPPGAYYQRPRPYQPPAYPPPDQPPPGYAQPRPPTVIHAPPPDQPPPDDNGDDEQGPRHPDGGGPDH